MIENPSEKDEIYLANVAKIGNSADNICYVQDVLSKEDHKTLLDYVKHFESWNKEPWGAKSIKSVDMSEEISNILQKAFTFVYEKANTLYDVEINPFNSNALQIVKFVKGFALEPHVDTLSVESLHIASVYYINDDYDGGEIHFPDYNIKIKPRANSIILFPGNENYMHEVREVLGGERDSSSMWFQFTGSEFNKKSEWYD
jgi:hypothetical protein